MGISSKTWVDNSAPTCDADDLNGINLEVNNAISDSGQTLSYTDREQLSKALSAFSSGGDFYTCGGVADTYTLTAVSPRLGVAALQDGMIFKFLVSATNTGASTLNVNGLAALALVDIDGTALSANAITINQYIEVMYILASNHFRIIDNYNTRGRKVEIIDYTTVNSPGTAAQIQAGHNLSAAEETLIGAMIAMFNLSDNTDISGNSNTLDDADAYNAAAGILNVASTAHLGVNGEHLQADAISDFSGTGDLNISIGGWHKPLVSSGLLAVGTNAAAQKIQYYTNANGYVVFDIAGVTGSSSSYVVGTWTHIAMVYDQTNSVCYCYINGQCENVISATTNLDIQAAPSIWVNSKTDGTLEVASYHDEIFIYEGVMSQDDVDYLYASTIPIPAALQGKSFNIIEQVKSQGDATYTRYQEFQEVARTTDTIYAQGRQWGSSDSVKLSGEVE